MSVGPPGELAEAVLAVVERIPPGKVLAYGDIAELVGTRSARFVGQVMFRYGGGVPWHRVVMASGGTAPHHAAEQLAMLVAEGVPLTADRSRVDMAKARWTPGSPTPSSARRPRARPR
jgi:alkylated DNA nucleotide flippase Atl1